MTGLLGCQGDESPKVLVRDGAPPRPLIRGGGLAGGGWGSLTVAWLAYSPQSLLVGCMGARLVIFGPERCAERSCAACSCARRWTPDAKTAQQASERSRQPRGILVCPPAVFPVSTCLSARRRGGGKPLD